MVHFLDSLPFDWSRRESRELRDFLAGVYFRDAPVIAFVSEAGMQPAAINWSQPMRVVWHEVIAQARNQNRLRQLLDKIAASDEAVAIRLGELASAHPVVEAPASQDYPIAWKTGSDDGDLERQIRDEPTLMDVAFLRRGADLAPSVARLLVTLPSGMQYYGTAFRIGDREMLTNHHVLFDQTLLDAPHAVAVEAWFNYEISPDGGMNKYEVIHCEPNTIMGERDDDWAVIRTATPISHEIPILGLDARCDVQVGDRVYIIQHPSGGMKKIGMHHNVVRDVKSDVIQYWTDTEGGSSGSPVFDSDWNLVALHHRWVQESVDGQPEFRNQGRRIDRVRERLYLYGIGS